MTTNKEKDSGNKMQTSLLFEVKGVTGLSSVGEESKFTVKLEYNGSVVGESPKVDLVDGNAIYPNHVFKYIYPIKDISDLEFLVNNPFVITVNEFKQKEKKQKESKIDLIGEVAFDCLELIQGKRKLIHSSTTLMIGEVSIEKVLPLLKRIPANHGLEDPQVTIVISIDGWSIGKKELEECNMLFVHLDSLQSPPEKLSTKDSTSSFVTVLPLCSTTESDNVIQFNNGATRIPTDSDYYEKLRRWNQQNPAPGAVGYIPGSFQDNRFKLNEEDGDFRTPEYAAFRQTCDMERPKIVWNQERRCILTNDLGKTRIAAQKLWPVEIAKWQKSSATKGKKDNEAPLSFHGVAYVNLTPLIYPGATQIRGAYRVVPYVETEYVEKVKRPNSLLMESLNVSSTIPAGSQLNPKKNSTITTAKQERKQPGKPIPEEHEAVDGDTDPVGPQQPSSVTTEQNSSRLNSEGQYVEAQSFIVIEFRLARPLVPKRTAEEVEEKIQNYLNQRKPVPSRMLSAQKAVSEYHNQIAEVARYILAEFRKHELFYSLNSTGKYFAFKERLKFAVVKVVREKFFRTKPFDTQEDLQVFLRDLYVFLIDEMHVGLRQVLKPHEKFIQPDGVQLTIEQLHRFAQETHIMGDYELAKLYYREAIAREPGCSGHWLRFGQFHLRNRDLEQAEVCFHQVLELEPKHPTGLILYGLVAGLENRVEEATDFLEAAVFVDKQNVIAWTVLGLYYETIANDIGSEMALNEAVRLDSSTGSAEITKNAETESELTTSQGLLVDNLTTKHHNLADSLQELNLPKEDSHLEQKDLIGMDGFNVEQQGVLNDATKPGKPDSFGSRSSSQRTRRQGYPGRSSRGMKPSAKNTIVFGSRESSQGISPPQPSRSSLFLRVAEFLLDNNCYNLVSTALAHELIQQKKQINSFFLNGQPKSSAEILPSMPVDTEHTESPTASLLALPSRPDWLVQQFVQFHLARIRLILGSESTDLVAAESEVNWVTDLDPQCAEAWAQLGHLRYLSGDLEGAREMYERCLALTTWPPEDPHTLRLRLGTIYLKQEEFQKAKHTFLAASKESPTCLTWLGVGTACYRLGELDNAEQALIEANYLNNRNPTVWAYLSLICLKTMRQTEAEQTYKYAIKNYKSSLKHSKDRNELETGEPKHVTILTEEDILPRTDRILSADPTMLKSILKTSLGLDQDAETIDIPISLEDERRVSSVTLEMLMEREEIDIHPYGRGGIYEGLLYKRRENEKLNIIAIVIWIIFSSSVVMISLAVVFVAELSYYLHSEETAEDREAYCAFFKTCKETSSGS
ncbi:unnamed protein product [Echinostoma caproni]|uniref:TPR_REGION domain-containing protein n=1 Tax=Echinostoma caproni TaxID=27848 RepID=A0A183A748_9TREM|nr:unnamed protein product [Echinostoma caproni]